MKNLVIGLGIMVIMASLYCKKEPASVKEPLDEGKRGGAMATRVSEAGAGPAIDVKEVEASTGIA
ncbi:MAG: hypothetical protein ACUVWQ_08060, partial [Candidatus Aminicenantales bacterium]